MKATALATVPAIASRFALPQHVVLVALPKPQAMVRGRREKENDRDSGAHRA